MSITAPDLIKKINSARNFTQVFENGRSLDEWKSSYIEMAKILHPDICKEDGAHEALSKLNHLKDFMEQGNSVKDEVGEIRVHYNKIVIKGDKKFIDRSYQNYTVLGGLKDDAAKNFQRYLPQSMIYPAFAPGLPSEGSYEIPLKDPAVPLSALVPPVDQKHVNWIVSRIMELAGWFRQIGYVHGGLTPHSVFVVPKTHGIICTTFYHMTKLGNPMNTVSGPFASFYPAKLFTDKKATMDIDVELAKRIGIYLLGDKSGNGTILKKAPNVNQAMLAVLQRYQQDPYVAFKEYRTTLEKEFKKEFIPMEDY